MIQELTVVHLLLSKEALKRRNIVINFLRRHTASKDPTVADKEKKAENEKTIFKKWAYFMLGFI